MTRQELQQLSKPERIEIILQQQGLIEQLQARVAELEDLVKRLSQPPKDASNSSTAPSKSRKPNRPDRKRKKKRGPKPGHEGRSRKRQEPDVIVECRPASCDRCGAELPQGGGRLLGRSRAVEIPPLEPVVIEARRYGCVCPECGRRQVGPANGCHQPDR